MKPKTEEEVVTTICERLDIPYNAEETDALINLHAMVQLMRTDKKYVEYHTMSYTNPEDWEGERQEIEGLTIAKINVQLTKQSVVINKRIRDWRIVYDKLVGLIVNNMQFLSVLEPRMIEMPLVSQIQFASNLIYKNTSRGPANWILVNNEFYEEHKDELHLNNRMLNILKDDKIDRPIVGRKGGDYEEGIYLFKWQKNYKLDSIGVIKNCYISL